MKVSDGLTVASDLMFNDLVKKEKPTPKPTIAIIKANKTTSTVLKKLKKKKTYYVRVRTYKKLGKKTYYSKWSNIKSVKIKK